jgi:hypothetical protein
MQHHKQIATYITESGSVNVTPDAFCVPSYGIEQKFIKRLTLPVHSMLFLIGTNDNKFHYMFVGKETVQFSTSREITKLSYGNIRDVPYKSYYAVTSDEYILLPENRSIRIPNTRNTV